MTRTNRPSPASPPLRTDGTVSQSGCRPRAGRTRWYVVSLLLFWCSTASAILIDYVGERWLAIAWTRGSDLFPGRALGTPLALAQLLAAVVLLIAVYKNAAASTTAAGVAWAVAAGALIAAGSITAYALLAVIYHVEVMGRSL